MIITKEFIWEVDHFVCHITEEKNMESIIENGLLPLNGDRCRFVMDDRIGVFGLDGIRNVPEWAECLYEQYELNKLMLLRFNLKMRKWHIDNSNPNAFGLYLTDKVLPQEIDFLQIKDKKDKILPFTKLFDLEFLYRIDESFNNMQSDNNIIVDDCSLSWNPINQYEKSKILVKK